MVHVHSPWIQSSFSDRLVKIKCSRNDIIITSKSWSEKPKKLLLDSLETLALSKACHHVKSLTTPKNTMLERPHIGTLVSSKADGPPTASTTSHVSEQDQPTWIYMAFSPSWHLTASDRALNGERPANRLLPSNKLLTYKNMSNIK